MLNLDHNRLTKLPTGFGQLSNLTYLNLIDNQLRELPPEIGQLSNLTSLNLIDNQLRELPPEIGQLNNLTSLNLIGNQLTKLPPEIGRLSNLTTLRLGYNQLRELPSEIGKLKNLTHLNLVGNQLSKLPPEISQLTNLTTLNLIGNQLTELPSEITQLTNLTDIKTIGKGKILFIATTDSDINMVIPLFLTELGYELIRYNPFPGGNQLVEIEKICNRSKPNVIILADDNFSVFMEQEFCKALRQNPSLSEIGILLIYIQSENFIRRVFPPDFCDADDKLRIPFDSEEFDSHLLELVDKHPIS